MIPNQREYDLVWNKPEFIYVMLTLLSQFSFRYNSYTKTELSKNYPVKVVPHRSTQIDRGLKGFNTSF